jgi:UDP-N-acetylmuramyl pentapeptide phosphotransferase/UDP-N-acetylglucosamine-1-phosphate transferase
VPLEARLLVGLTLAMAIVYAATPLAIRLAAHFDFYDVPAGYKGHRTPTPYLGGTAVITGFVLVVVALTITSQPRETVPVLGGVLVLWVIGTLDDRRIVGVGPRVAAEVGLAAVLWATDLGWSLGLGGAVDLLATAIWVVAVVNAFNLFDNMDGASSTMASVVAAAVAVLGLVQSDVWLVATGAALCGACLGFLPHNLSRPSARIFLGDGGSMPIGFAIAALVMIGASSAAAEWQALVLGLLLVGVPARDTCLVVVSRRRRGIPILTGGRDHLTHRTRARMSTVRASVAALGAGQALLAALALVAVQGGPKALVPVVLLYLAAMASVIAVLDAKTGDAVATAVAAPAVEAAEGAGHDRLNTWPPLAILAAFGIALGLSPFASGFYDSSIWAPAGLGVLVVLTAALIAGPVRVPLRVALVPGAIAALALLALLSALWTDSIEQAVVEGNRMLLYAAALGLLVVLLRSDRGAVLAFGAFGLGALAVAGWVIAGMLDDDATLFFTARLHEPLGYINGQSSFFVLAFWPCVALAERRDRRFAPALAGLGLGCATLFAGLAVLGQSRGAILAAALSLIVVLGLLPGRLRRIVALLVCGACLAPAIPALLDVYGDGVTPDRMREGAIAVLLAAVAAGVIWALLVGLEQRGRASGLRPRRVVALGVAALAVLAVALGVASAGRIADYADRQYDAFVTLGGAQGGEATSSRLASGAGNRYDYWRIAVDAWREHPLAGIGAGGYDKPYFAQRTTDEDIRQPHSLPLQVLAELGIAGGLLLAAALLLIATGAWRRIRAGLREPVVVAALGAVTAWFVHTSVDWLHLLPGLTGVALLGVAVLLRPAGGADDAADEAAQRAGRALGFASVRSRGARLAPALLVAVAIMVAALSLSRQSLSELYVDRAQDALAADPARALVEANRALRLDHESLAAYYAKAAALARFGEGGAARAVLLDATRREPREFVTWVLLGDLSTRQGQRRAAAAEYARAHALNPRDVGIAKLAADAKTAISRTTG